MHIVVAPCVVDIALLSRQHKVTIQHQLHMLLEQGHKEGQEKFFEQLSKVWKRDNFPKLGRKKALKRLEVKRGEHHIPNP
jgi:ribulose bisphosphate carboxylase small subunit